MSKSELTNLRGVATNQIGGGLVYAQRSYSTDELENFVFYGQSAQPVPPTGTEPIFNAIAVLGELHPLDQDSPFPQQAKPLDDTGGVFRLIGIDKEESR